MLETAARVDLLRYLGTWHEIASFPQSFQRGCTATTATDTLRPDGDIDVLTRRCEGSIDGNEKAAPGLTMKAMRHPNYRKITQTIRHRADLASRGPLVFPEEDAALFFVPFESVHANSLLGHAAYSCEVHGLSFPGEPADGDPADDRIAENVHFRYPLLSRRDAAANGGRAKRIIILLHGLNERSFTKYVPWAFHLWRATGAAIALFPLAFHINRGHPSWSRQVSEHLARRSDIDGNEHVHAFNAVNSERLGCQPERSFWGGEQSFGDIVDLVRDIRQGGHPDIDPGARVDFVGFSAGGYVTLALLLTDPEGLFGESRAVLVASGASLRDTFLSSRFILDLAAATAMVKLYVRQTAKYAGPRLWHWLEAHEEGRWFRALCGGEAERERLERRLASVAPRLLGIGNRNDEVIPVRAMLNTLQGLHRDTGVRVEELSLGIHENPFGCAGYAERDRVAITEFLDLAQFGEGFERFITLASGFLG